MDEKVNRPNQNLGQYYHETSKDLRMGGMVNIPKDISLWPKNWTIVNFKQYRYPIKRVDLIDVNDFYNKKVGINSRNNFLDILSLRETLKLDTNNQRNFTLGINKINLKELSYLLGFAFGLNKINRSNDFNRFHPSGGGRYALEYYIFVNKSEDLERGTYHYNIKEHKLEMIKKISKDKSLPKLFAYDWAQEAACYIIITSVFDRLYPKYGERGYRYALLEAGHVGQNLCLLCSDLSISICPIGGTFDVQIENELMLDGHNETVVYSLVLG
jgi:SagB-type dehydrogenase family enzyme